MSQMKIALQNQIKASSESFSTFLIKVFSGLILALTLTLIFQEIIGFETLSFVLMSSAIYLGFMKAAKNWKLGSTLIFDLICILIALLLRMYVLIAPGA